MVLPGPSLVWWPGTTEGISALAWVPIITTDQS